MTYTTLGVIGHVDHGKTSLVKALTGVDTDRLKEEKERGISIALGYAHLQLPAGEIGIIDAPGHERFIRTMVAGATGMRAVLLVLDVNEGVMPQTIEHLDIAAFLGVQRGVMALTKCDTASENNIQRARDQVRAFAASSFLGDAPIVETSAATGLGLDDLKAALNAVLGNTVPPEDEGVPCLPIDRVFSLPGFGTVVTGTLRRGTLAVGDEVCVYPSDTRGRVRGLQSHSAFVDHLPPGRRAAVNLRGIDKDSLARGDVLAAPGSLAMTAIASVHLRLLPHADAPLRNRQHVRILFGTRETFGRIHFLDRDELAPGDACVLQIRLDESIPLLNGDPFILRACSPMTTIGGGRFLAPAGKAFRRKDAAAVARLETCAHGTLPEILAARIAEAGLEGVTFDDLARHARLHPILLPEQLHAVSCARAGGRIVDSALFGQLQDHLLATVHAFHQINPTLPGMPKDQLRLAAPRSAFESVVATALESLQQANKLTIDGATVRLAQFHAGDALGPAGRALADSIAKTFRGAGMKPPRVDEAIGHDDNKRRLYRYLLDQGVLVQAHVPTRAGDGKASIAFHRDALGGAHRELLKKTSQGRFTTAEAKEILGVSRRYLIPLLESLDALGLTTRQGEVRVLTPDPRPISPNSKILIH